jgi:DNA-binding SARP family transcriptional activator
MLEFRLLGPLEVLADGNPISLGGRKQRATLAILLLHANSIVSVDRLADDLYSGAPPVTAVTQVQRQISELRKTLRDASAIETRAPGYVLRASAQQLDLHEFERLAEEGSRALDRGDADAATDLLRRALELWRGEPLADVGYEDFAQQSIERLEELRLAVLEQRIEADLARGRHTQLVGELEELTRTHPLRERLHGQLMVALYRSGRQVDALGVYRRARSALRDEFGVEPGPTLEELERAVLKHDPALDVEQRPAGFGGADVRVVLAVATDAQRLEDVFAVAVPLAAQSHELIAARLVEYESELPRASASVNELRAAGPGLVRGAAFTTSDPWADMVRLVRSYDAELLLLAAPTELRAGRVPDGIAALLERSAADVALLAGGAATGAGEDVFVPFGGSEHDWAALELAAWLAWGSEETLRLVGTRGDPAGGRRDASRLLADAAVAVQRVVGVQTEPLLVDAAGETLIDAVELAKVVVIGISPRWRRDGIGATRHALVDRARPPTLLVHHGPRPGVLAPRTSGTRFTWTIQR